MKTSDCTCWLC